MKRPKLALLLAVAVLAGILLLASRPVKLTAGEIPLHKPDLANGERLFDAGGCAACHAETSGNLGRPELGGGVALPTPFGTFHAPNISPHPERGIGAWSTLDFINAMHGGVSPDGRHYYPAFPYPSYSRMSLEDLLDLKAFLDTLPPVDDRNRDHDLGFPWSIRAGIGLWKWFNLDSSFVISVPPDNGLLLRGRYLVEGPGHCGECHTPRNGFGGLDYSRWLAGAVNPAGEGEVPNITNSGDGLADWSPKDIAYYLESGFTPDFDTVGGSMVAVQESMARLSAADREAIAAYLKIIPARD